MTSETALEIGEIVGLVMVPQDRFEMKGGTFVRVQVTIDVARPLCRGRRVAFEDGLEGWVAFQPKRLPSICFWCGMLSYDDKECELWLKSKGTLLVDQQQFGHWISAFLFSPGRHQIIEVKGFEPAALKKSPLIETGDELLHRVSKSHLPLLSNDERVGGADNQSKVRPMSGVGRDGLDSKNK